MAFNDVKFYIGKDVETAYSSSTKNKGSFYIVANDEVAANKGSIWLNGHVWYEAVGGITNVSAGTSGSGETQKVGLVITEAASDGTPTSKFVEIKGATYASLNQAVNTSVALDGEALVVKAGVELADAANGMIQTLNISNGKLDGSVKLSYDGTNGKLAIENANGAKTEVNLPLESFLVDGQFIDSESAFEEFINDCENSATTYSKPSLVLKMKETAAVDYQVVNKLNAIVIPADEMFELYDVQKGNDYVSITSSASTTGLGTTTFTVTPQVKAMADVQETDTALADAADVKAYVDKKAADAKTVVEHNTANKNITVTSAPAEDGHVTFTVNETGLTPADGYYVKAAKTVADNLTALDAQAKSLQNELDASQSAIGLASDGTHVATNGNYTSGASTIVGEIAALDTELKRLNDEVGDKPEAATSLTSTTVWDALKEIADEANAAHTVVCAKTPTEGEHITVTVTPTGNGDLQHDVVTVTESDIASESAFTAYTSATRAEISAVETALGGTYNTETSAFTLPLNGTVVSGKTVASALTDLNTALDAVSAQSIASKTLVVKDSASDNFSGLTIASAVSQTTNALTYTVKLENVAEKSEVGTKPENTFTADTVWNAIKEVKEGAATAISGLDATVSSETVSKHVKVEIVEEDGKLTSVTLTDSDIASDSATTTTFNTVASAMGATITTNGVVAYTANSESNYLKEATSLANADNKLDAQLKEVADKVSANTITAADKSIIVTSAATGTTIKINVVGDKAIAVSAATADDATKVSLTLDGTTTTGVKLSQSNDGLKAELSLNGDVLDKTSTESGVGLEVATDGRVQAKMMWGAF